MMGAIAPLLGCVCVQVLHAAGISRPRAVAIGYTARQRAMTAVETLRENFPDVPIYARAVDMKHAAELEAAGPLGGVQALLHCANLTRAHADA
jgi:hypothetical protein